MEITVLNLKRKKHQLSVMCMLIVINYTHAAAAAVITTTTTTETWFSNLSQNQIRAKSTMICVHVWLCARVLPRKRFSFGFHAQLKHFPTTK